MTNLKSIKINSALILGATGFIGTYLMRHLLGEGLNVRIITRDRNRVSFKDQSQDNIQVIQGDYSDLSILRPALDGIDFVYYLASSTQPRTSNENPFFDINTNLGGAISLLNELKLHPQVKLIFTSSGGTIYGNSFLSPLNEDHPTNPLCSYGIVKLAIEKYIEMYFNEYNIDYQILRISNPYGLSFKINPQQGLIPNLIYKIKKGFVIEIWGDGTIIRDYIYVDDLIDALYKAALITSNRRILNIGTGVGHSVNDVVSTVSEAMDRIPKVIYKPKRSFDVSVNVLDCSLAKENLNWIPQYSLIEGVNKILGSSPR